uniref:PDZ domain-containing protein n=1 Tax=Entomoneis paludosa TaxID=265537 RepID=A0A7S3DN85_9STRA|mmetsp:Transcript_22910/g.47799  ORF Transcript_22910/g.47799 Transcript_22910/m.47799 type:complete len:214 (+) Transcript_22910:285-926(+)|eukprot:CAMPEP_0172439520 /NCGR_PEP_ID=MMETSP1065-20121228/480_1 /TAXON_ID=265537 /ORGANISM="Amphiprora paludosa, Strain CCMP125" /LENGTH=213 /DNA_ID=CAMNT_0013188215 /DNA_START=98 /DNA_END=739 /DNA_ORIENTATION=-
MNPMRILTAAATVAAATGFAIAPQTHERSNTVLNMGLFDGVKDAFGAPALERSQIDSERETPIDRWMGWSVVSDNDKAEQAAAFANVDFVDAMDETNYVAVELAKPMGIVFEENDSDYGGIFVQSLKEDGIAAQNGVLQEGDQLVAVNTVKVSGLPFDDALGAIIDSEGETTKLVLFRGDAKQFYGKTGASQDWLDDFVNKGGVETAAPVQAE